MTIRGRVMLGIIQGLTNILLFLVSTFYEVTHTYFLTLCHTLVCQMIKQTKLTCDKYNKQD